MAEAEGEVAPEGEDLDSGSAVHLQRSLHALLERRGVMQDLRAHLRAHLVSLIRNAQQDKPLVCKSLQAQRLELKFQALNILIVEYLLRQEFNYTLSVFSSEIPLASMVFHYAQNLLSKPEHDRTDVKFDEEDVRQIMNVLGVPCGTEQARHTAEIYRNSPQQPPLLMCILQSFQRLEKDETLKSAPEEREYCSHANFCEVCRGKRKFESENKKFAQNLSDYCAIHLNREEMNLNYGYDDASDVERDLVDEMFQELKTVYESETAMLRSTQESHLQQSLASYQAKLHRREKELEEEYQARIEAKERNLEERKGLLWRLARRLRQQHTQLTEAMHKVEVEKRQIELREDNLKEQLKNAENLLKRNGDEMREQLSEELKLLEQHIDVMKTERDNITQERTELEKLKMTLPNQSDEAKTQFEEQKRKNVDLQRHYDILRDELSIVQKYLASTKTMEHKPHVEASSLTDIYGVHSRLPNEFEEKNHVNSSAHLFETKSAASLPMYNKDTPMNNSTNGRNLSKTQLINDLKKFKNVNFRNDSVVQVNVDASNIPTTELTAAADNKQTSEQTDKMIQELLTQFRDDNLALRNFVSQQQEHIRELLSEQGKLRAELATAQHTVDNMTRLASIAAPVPTSSINTPLPCSADRGTAGTAQVFRPVTSVRETVVATTAVQRDSPARTIVNHTVDDASFRAARQGLHRTAQRCSTRLTAPRPTSSNSPRTATFDPQSVSDISERGRIRKHKVFRRQEYADYPQVDLHDSDEASSPTDEVLAAAKLRLKKLEIEAEVVEQSYLDFRRRHAPNTSGAVHDTQRLSATPQRVDYNTSRPLFGKYGQYTARNVNAQDSFKERSQEFSELDKYVNDYKNRTNKIHINPSVPQNHFSNPGQTYHYNYSSNNNETHLNKDQDVINIDKYNGKLVEKSLTEFRRLYHMNKKLSPTTHIRRALQELRSKESPQKKDRESNIITSVNNSSKPPFTSRRNYNARVVPARKLTEDEETILKSKIQKMYGMSGAPKSEKQELDKKINIALIEGSVTSENSIVHTGKNSILDHTMKNTELRFEYDLPQSKPMIEEKHSDTLSAEQSKIFQETIIQNAEQTNGLLTITIGKNTSLQRPSDKAFKDIAELTHDKTIEKDSEQNNMQNIHGMIQNTIPETLPQVIIETNSQNNNIIISNVDGERNNNEASDHDEKKEKAAQNIEEITANNEDNQENFINKTNHPITTVNIYKAPLETAILKSISYDLLGTVSKLDETVSPTSIESVVHVQDLTSITDTSIDNEVDQNSKKMFKCNKDITNLLNVPLNEDIQTTVTEVLKVSSVNRDITNLLNVPLTEDIETTVTDVREVSSVKQDITNLLNVPLTEDIETTVTDVREVSSVNQDITNLPNVPLTEDIETTVTDVREVSSVNLISSKGSPTRTDSYVLAEEMEDENSSEADLSADVDNNCGTDSNKSYDSSVSIAKSEKEDSFWE